MAYRFSQPDSSLLGSGLLLARCAIAVMLVPLLAFAMSQATPAQTFMNDGAYLYRSCQAWIRVSDAKITDDVRKDLADGAFCVAYIAGFVDGTGTVKRGACLDSATSVEQVVRPYVAYMLKHPEVMHSDRRIGLVLALADSFPCPTK